MGEEVIYSLLFLLTGVIGIIWAQQAPKAKGDPFLIKVSQYSFGFLSILIGLYLMFKYLFSQ